MEGVNFFLIQVIAAVQRLMHHRVNMLARSGEDGLFSELAPLPNDAPWGK